MARKRKGNNVQGILLLDKPLGLSSNQALQRCKHLLNAQKAGHTGTLDPMATGLLPLCFGNSTKISQYLLDSDKGYFATIKYGITTESGDAEGSVIATAENIPELTLAQLEVYCEHLRGDIEQIPPMFSALKHQGKPLYLLAREGIEIERKPRQVTIYKLEILRLDPTLHEIDIQVHCSKGTYIRSLAISLGEMIGCGAHLIGLHRTHCGLFSIDQAIGLDKLAEQSDIKRLEHLVSPEQAFTNTPIYTIPQEWIRSFYDKGKLPPTQHHGIVRLYCEQTFVAIAEFINGEMQHKQIFIRYLE